VKPGGRVSHFLRQGTALHLPSIQAQNGADAILLQGWFGRRVARIHLYLSEDVPPAHGARVRNEASFCHPDEANDASGWNWLRAAGRFRVAASNFPSPPESPCRAERKLLESKDLREAMLFLMVLQQPYPVHQRAWSANPEAIEQKSTNLNGAKKLK
jgi:hypothetical protein